MRFQTLFEGRWIFAILLILAIGSALISWWLALFFVALILYTIAFFRDPNRPDPADQCAVVAAADGTIADIQEIDEEEFLKARTKRIGSSFPSLMCTPIARPLAAVLLFNNIAKAFFLMRAGPNARKKTKR